MSKFNDSELVQISDKGSSESGISRRSFLKVLGASSATILTACAKDAAQKVIPFSKAETETIPGISAWYSSTCTECSAGCGISVRTREGRAVKVEGNPLNPVNKGGLCGLGQASLQAHYDPDRIRQPMKRVDGAAGKAVFKPISWTQAYTEIADALAKAASAGQETAFISEDFGGGTLDKLAEAWSASLKADHVVYNSMEPAAWASATEMLYGKRGIPQLDFEKAEIVLNFGADFLETWVSPCEYAKAWANSRRKEVPTRYIHIEPRASLTAANADHFFLSAAGSEQTLALAILRSVILAGRTAGLSSAEIAKIKDITSAYSLNAASRQSGIELSKLEKTVGLLLAAKQSLVIAGGTVIQSQGGLAVSLVAQLLNQVLGNSGKSFDPSELRSASSSISALTALAKKMQDKKIGVLFTYKANPAFSLPADYGFSYAMKLVPLVVSFSSHLDETASAAQLLLPASSGLETWGDMHTLPEVYSLIQPSMTPLFDTRDLGDILIQISAAAGRSFKFENLDITAQSKFVDCLKASWQKIHAQSAKAKSFDDFWDESLEKGGYFSTVTANRSAAFRGLTTQVTDSFKSSPVFADKGAEDSEIVLYPFNSVKGFDGRAANRPWMQELPDPMSQVVWDSWAELHPETAAKLGIENGDKLTVRNYYGELNLPAYLTAHVAKNVIAIPIGQGHTAYGRYAQESSESGNVFSMLPALKSSEDKGVNLYSTKVKVIRARGYGKMVQAQKESSQHGREIARTAFLSSTGLIANPKKEPHFNHSVVHESDSQHFEKADIAGHENTDLHAATGAAAVAEHAEPHKPKQMYEQREFPVYKWGMSIDLNACTGCSACVVACHAENNVPVVGKHQVSQGRRMSWIQIQRYEDGSSEDLQVSFIPMTCQHCSNAPCEPVCPVYATYHNEEGLNAMVYNRCVGTRYCANNCSYKVRRFNWFDYEFPEPLNYQLNPDVNKRTAGVMEKCSFCVQRIVESKDAAKDLGRLVKDGEVRPACVQSCPTEALVFGNLNDPESKVSKMHKDSRAYKILDYHLNTQPAVSYLDRVKFEKI